MTGNDRLEKVTPSLELVRISNHAIKRMIEANLRKNRSKLFQPSEINHVACPRLFQGVTYVSAICVIIL